MNSLKNNLISNSSLPLTYAECEQAKNQTVLLLEKFCDILKHQEDNASLTHTKSFIDNICSYIVPSKGKYDTDIQNLKTFINDLEEKFKRVCATFESWKTCNEASLNGDPAVLGVKEKQLNLLRAESELHSALNALNNMSLVSSTYLIHTQSLKSLNLINESVLRIFFLSDKKMNFFITELKKIKSQIQDIEREIETIKHETASKFSLETLHPLSSLYEECSAFLQYFNLNTKRCEISLDLNFAAIQEDLKKSYDNVAESIKTLLNDPSFYRSSLAFQESAQNMILDYDQKIYEVLNTLRNSLRKKLADPSLTVSQMRQIDIFLKELKVRMLDGENESLMIAEDWLYSTWGGLLIEIQPNYFSFWSKDFETSIAAIEESNNEPLIKEKIKLQALLERIIEVVGSKTRLLQNKEAPLSESQREVVEYQITLLNQKFDECMSQYRGIPESSEGICASLLKQAANLMTFGNYQHSFKTTEELQIAKRFADFGYSPFEAIKKWLETVSIKNFQDMKECFRKEIDAFLVWADSDIETAAALTSDLLLTCSYLKDEGLYTKLHDTMKLKAFVAAFHSGLNLFDQPKMKISEETLKYYALSQIVKYAPAMAAALQSMVHADFSNPLKLVLSSAGNVLGAVAVQQIKNFIPSEYAKDAILILDVLKGESLQTILAEQRNLALAEMGGAAYGLISNPKNFLTKLGLHLNKTWKVFKLASGPEKMVRIFFEVIVPLSILLATVGSLAFAPLSSAIVITSGLGLLTISVLVANRVHALISKFTMAKEKAEKAFEEEKKLKAKKMIKTQVGEEVKKFIKNCVKATILPATQLKIQRPACSGDQTPPFDLMRDTLVENLKKRTEEKWQDETVKTAEKLAMILGENLKAIDISLCLEQLPNLASIDADELENVKKVVLYETTKKMKNWLGNKAEEIFIEIALKEPENHSIKLEDDYEDENRSQDFISLAKMKLSETHVDDQLCKLALSQIGG